MRDPAELHEVKAIQVGRLKRRADFLRVAKGKRWHSEAMTVQAAASDEAGVRIGFTLTRKVGSAVVRNRARRRLKEAVRHSPDLPVARDHDYVIVGRIEAVCLPFEALKQELATGVRNASARRQETRSKRAKSAS